jgi:hypothetical protein
MQVSDKFPFSSEKEVDELHDVFLTLLCQKFSVSLSTSAQSMQNTRTV